MCSPFASRLLASRFVVVVRDSGMKPRPAVASVTDGRDPCLRADGSGWIIVRKAACVTSNADHCGFDRRSCIGSAITREPNWIGLRSTAPFALRVNADWVARTLAPP